VGTQLQAVVFALTALKGLAVQETLKVNDGGVAFLGLPLHGHQTGVAVGQLFQAGVHILGGNGHFILRRGQALVLTQSHLGVHGHGGLEGKAVLGAFANHLHVGISDDPQLLLLGSRLIGVGKCNIDGFLKEYLCAVHLLDQLAGGLAGAKALHIDLIAHLAVRFFEGNLKFRCTDLNGQRDLTIF